MIDLRTLLLGMAAADLLLAAALWLGASRALHEGLSHWAGALVVRALGLAVVAWQAPMPPGALAVGTGLVALSVTLQAAAVLAYDRRGFPAWLHTAVLAAVAVPFQLLEADRALALVFGGIVFGILLLAVAAMAGHLRHAAGSRARAMVLAAFAGGGMALLLHGIGALLAPEPLAGFPVVSGFAAATLLAAAATSIAASFAFLMMHKERAEAQALRLATTDPLTGAYNRRTFHEIAERELSRVRRAGQPLSIIMLDIDNFRAVNEAHGHRVGDEVLQRFAERVRSALRKEDMLVRSGGEDFLVLLPDVPGPGAVVVAGRIRRLVAAAPVEAGEHRLALTVSLGVAARLDEGPESLETLLARAGSALALAKERGRNRVVALSLGRSIAA